MKITGIPLQVLDNSYVALAPTSSTRNVIQPTNAAYIPLIVKGAVSQTANLMEWQNSSAGVLASISSVGDWGIGASPSTTNKLIFQKTQSVDAVARGIFGTTDTALVSPTTQRVGINAAVRHSAASGIATDSSIALVGAVQNLGAGRVGNAYGFQPSIQTTSGPITNARQININDAATSGGGVIDTLYGIYISNQSKGTTNYAILTNAGNVVFNEGGDASTDFRVEGDTEANMIFLDASADTLQLGGTTNYAQIAKGGMITFGGTGGIQVPHMMQSDSTDQAIANVANAQVITFDTDVHHEGITRTSSSRFTITKAGSYLITFSGIAAGVATKTIQVWLRINGSDVANTNTRYVFKGTAQDGIVAVSFLQRFELNDYFEFWTWGDDTGCSWDATAAGSTPTRPASPSIIVTANYVSGD